jgi:hypothetical protein
MYPYSLYLLLALQETLNDGSCQYLLEIFSLYLFIVLKDNTNCGYLQGPVVEYNIIQKFKHHMSNRTNTHQLGSMFCEEISEIKVSHLSLISSRICF